MNNSLRSVLKFTMFAVLMISTMPASAMNRTVMGSKLTVLGAARVSNLQRRNYALLTNKERDNLIEKLWEINNTPESFLEFKQELSAQKMDHEDLKIILNRLENSEFNPAFIREYKWSESKEKLYFVGACISLIPLGPFAILLMVAITSIKTPQSSDAIWQCEQRNLSHVRTLLEKERRVARKY